VSGLVAAACFEFGMSSVCHWSLSWLLVRGAAPTGASL
jgi:hypothetical protein